MTLSEKLEYLISTDPTQGIAGVRRFAGEVDRGLTGVESRIGRTSATLAKIGAGGIGVGGLLTQLGSGEQQAAQQLDAAITQVGQSVDEYRGRIEEAEKTQTGFGHTNEETQQSLATLTLSYNDTGKALDVLQLTSDLAAKKHESLGEAATQVAKAHGGAGRLFKEFGIQVKENVDGTKDYDGALSVLAQKLTGQASAAIDTPIGKLKVLATEVQNTAASFGERFGPSILGVSLALTAAGTVGQGVAAIQGRLTASHLASAAAAEAQAAAEAELAAAEALVTTNSSAAVASLYAQDAALVGSSAAFGAWGIAAAAAIVVASEALDIFGAKADHDFGPKLQERLGQTGKDLADQYTFLLSEGNQEDPGKFLKSFETAGTAGIGALTNLRDALHATGQDTTAVDQAIADATDSQNNYSAAVNTGTRALTGTNAALTKQEQLRRSSLNGVRSVYDAERSYEASERGVTDALRSVQEATDRVADARERLTKAQQGASGEDLEKASLDISDAQYREQDSAKALATEQQKLDRMRAKGIATADEIVAQERKVGEANNQHERDLLAVTDAEKHLQEVQAKGSDSDQAVIDARKGLDDANRNLAGTSQAVQDAQAAEADAAAKLKDAQQGLGDRTGDTTLAIDNQITAFQDLASHLAPDSALRKNVEDYINDLLLLRAITSTPFVGPGLDQTPPGYTPQFGGGKASGGSVTAGMSYRVGERGEELFTPWATGWITPNSGVQAARAGGSSQPVVYLSQVLREDVADDAARGVTRGLILSRR